MPVPEPSDITLGGYIFVQYAVKEDIKLVSVRKSDAGDLLRWKLISSRGDRKQRN